jgi:hypothetical protein
VKAANGPEVTITGPQFRRRRDNCKHDGHRLTGDTSSETITLCAECGKDLTVRTDPRIRALIESIYSAPPEVVAARFIMGGYR